MTGKEYDRYFRSLYLPLGMYTMRIVDDAQWAEDIVEDAFTKAWQAIADGQNIIDFKAYMYQIVRDALSGGYKPFFLPFL